MISPVFYVVLHDLDLQIIGLSGQEPDVRQVGVAVTLLFRVVPKLSYNSHDIKVKVSCYNQNTGVKVNSYNQSKASSYICGSQTQLK